MISTSIYRYSICTFRGGISLLPIILMIENEKLRSKLEEVYTLYKKEAYWTAYKILFDKQDAGDVVHDAIIKLATTIEKKEESECNKIRGLFVIIVRQLSINKYNRRKTISFTSYDERIDDTTNDFSIDDEIIRLEQAKIIANSLGKLNQSYADILTLKYYYELSNIEISKSLNITEGNVRIRIHRAKQAAKKIMIEEVDSFGFK